MGQHCVFSNDLFVWIVFHMQLDWNFKLASDSWVSICFFKLYFRVYRFLHILQLNWNFKSGSDLWVSMCLFKSLFCVNRFLHILQLYWNFKSGSDSWVSMCCFKWLFCVHRFLHTWQLNLNFKLASDSWVSMCFFKSLFSMHCFLPVNNMLFSWSYHRNIVCLSDSKSCFVVIGESQTGERVVRRLASEEVATTRKRLFESVGNR
jgi:hypothetical protein